MLDPLIAAFHSAHPELVRLHREVRGWRRGELVDACKLQRYVQLFLSAHREGWWVRWGRDVVKEALDSVVVS